MNALLQRVQNKLQEARLSDINHELGKVKEQLIAESNVALTSLKRHFNKPDGNGLPKSVSLPIGLSSHAANSDRYCYKSSVQPLPEEPEEPEEEQKALDKFIRVIESNGKSGKSRGRRNVATASRDEIRRKLAGLAPSTSQQVSNDLQICFINEIVVDEEDDGDDLDSDEVDLSLAEAGSPEELQSLVASKLAACETLAKQQLAKEKRVEAANKGRNEGINSPLRRILERIGGEQCHDEQTLQQLSRAALQLLLNHLHCRVEKLNCELVTLLELKDELLIEQDSQLLDLEDLALLQPRQRNSSQP